VVQSRLPLWQAALWVLLGGVGAQLAGGIVSGTLRAVFAARGMTAEQLDRSAMVIVPALMVSGLSLTAVALIGAATSGVRLRDALGLRPAPPACFAAAAFGTVMLGPAADFMMRLAEKFFPDFSLGVVPMLHELVRNVPLIIAVPAFALAPGISEELMFRGLLQNAAGRGLLGIMVSALAFSAFHLDPHHVAGVLPLGFFLAWVGARCGTLVTIFAHVLNNAVAIAAVHSETLSVGYGTDKEMPWPWLPASLLLVAASVFVITRATQPPERLQSA
jgi:membrane protease YdiL (CAAX protease family)